MDKSNTNCLVFALRFHMIHLSNAVFSSDFKSVWIFWISTLEVEILSIFGQKKWSSTRPPKKIFKKFLIYFKIWKSIRCSFFCWFQICLNFFNICSRSRDIVNFVFPVSFWFRCVFDFFLGVRTTVCFRKSNTGRHGVWPKFHGVSGSGVRTTVCFRNLGTTLPLCSGIKGNAFGA